MFCALKPLKIFWAAVSSICFIACFPDYNLFLLGWFFLVPLFKSIENETTSCSFFLGWFSGTIAFIGTVSWVTNSMTNYGGIPLPLGFFFLLLLSLYLGLFPGLFCLLHRRVENRFGTVTALCAAPFLWVSLEYARGHLMTGFPWAIIAYSQWRLSSLIQVADMTGVYGVSFLILTFNSACYYTFFYRNPVENLPVALKVKRKVMVSLVPVILILCFLSYGQLCKISYEKEISAGDSINVAVIQGNIEQSVKWERDEQLESLEKHFYLTDESLKCSPELVVWPETALPFYLEKEVSYMELISSFVKERGIFLIAGSVGYTNNEQGADDIFNSAFFVDSDGNIEGRYDKRHLVPFGEYVPFEKIFKMAAFDRIIGEIGSFKEGDESKVFNIGKEKVSVIICYELIFPELVRTFAAGGSGMIVNITNDGWFGKSSAPLQHFSNAVFRAIENRVFIVRSANTGISGIVDPLGSVLGSTGLFVPAWLCGKIYFPKSRTFYTNYGDIFAYICIAISLMFIAFGKYKSLQQRD